MNVLDPVMVSMSAGAALAVAMKLSSRGGLGRRDRSPARPPEESLVVWTVRTEQVREAVRCRRPVPPATIVRCSAAADPPGPLEAAEEVVPRKATARGAGAGGVDAGEAAPRGVPRLPAMSAAVGGHGRVCVLGCPAVFDRAGERVRGFRETALELLVYLVVHRDGVPVEAIRRDVYPTASPQRAAERLSTDLANLRDRLRRAAGVDRQVNPVVRIRGGYSLAPDVLDVDWWDVLDNCQLLRSVRSDAGMTEAAVSSELEALLRQVATAFDAGVLADGAGYGWLAGPQERSRKTGIAAHQRLAVVVTHKNLREAAAVLDRACDLDPYDEDLAREAIIAHQKCGDGEAAGARVDALRAALIELDETPAAAIVALASRTGKGDDVPSKVG